MSFIGAATAMGLTGIGATIGAGVMMGGATTIGMNLIRGNDPFDNIGQGILMGGITGGIFGGAGGAAAGVGEGAAASASFDAAGNMIPIKDMATSAFSDSTSANLGSRFGTSNFPGGSTDLFGFKPVSGSYNIAPPGANPVYVAPPSSDFPVPAEVGDSVSQARAYEASQQPFSPPSAPSPAEPAPGATDMRVNTRTPLGGYTDQFGRNLDATGTPISNVASKTSTATASPKFSEDMLGYLTHKDNRGTAMLGGLGIAGAMGAFKPNTLKTEPKTASFYETTYNPPKFVTDPITGRVTYVAGSQGYGPGNRVTRNIATGGGIRALSGVGETAPYVPMTARGQMTIKEDVPDDLDDSAPIEKYSKYEINKKEKKGQAEIDKNVSSWLERYAKADVKGMAEGGPAQQVTQFQPTFSTAPQGIGSLPYQAPNVPAMESSPTDYNQSPQYAPTTSYSAPAANPMTAGLGSYLEGLKYKAPPVASPTYRDSWAAVAPPGTPASYENPPPALMGAGREGYSSGNDAGGGYGDGGGYDPVTQTYSETTPTSPTLYSPDTQTYSETTPTPTLYNPATQRYSDNPAFTAPVAKDSGSDSGYFYDDEGDRRSVYDEDGNRRYNDDGSNLYDDSGGGDGDKAGGPITSKRYAMGGLAALPEYAAGGKLLSGDGDGMSDSIPAVIKGERPQRAALADGEFVIPADVVSHLGNGSTKAGGKRLYEMMANIRKARTGNPKQGKQINPMKFMPT